MYILNVMIKTINTTNLRNNLKEATTYVRESKRPLIITERGVPTTVLVDIDEYEDYLESHNKEYVASVKTSREQIKKGEFFTMDEVFGSIK